MAHIIVVGAGVGGVPCAYELRKKLGKNHRVTLVGSSPYFEFTPSNPWIAVGWRKCETTRVEMREPLDSKGIDWHDEPVESIDASKNSLRLRSGAELAYDYLVIATGPKLALSHCRKFHRATSPGRKPASGFTWQRSRSKSISCAKCAPARSHRFTRNTFSNCSASAR